MFVLDPFSVDTSAVIHKMVRHVRQSTLKGLGRAILGSIDQMVIELTEITK